MGLFNFNKKEKDTITNDNKGIILPELFEFGYSEPPLIKEVRGKDYIQYGVNNLYKDYLVGLKSKSVTHGAIVDNKSQMMAGDGYLFNGSTDKASSKAVYDTLDPTTKIALDNFLNNPNNDEDLSEIITQMANDFQTFGEMGLEVIWSLDFSKILTLKYMNMKNIRTGCLINGKIQEFYYCRDWSNERNNEIRTIAAFDPDNKEHYNQLIYVKNGNDNEYYGQLPYKSALGWIDIEAKMETFHNSNLSNSFAPSMMVKFYEKPSGDEEKAKIIASLKQTYQGAINTGKLMVFFSNGKDLSTDVIPIQVPDLDKQYLALTDLAARSILTGSKVTSPALFAIQTSGSLSQGTELTVAYNIFNKSVIAPDRNKINKVLNKILKINKVPVTIELAPFNPLPQSQV